MGLKKPVKSGPDLPSLNKLTGEDIYPAEADGYIVLDAVSGSACILETSSPISIRSELGNFGDATAADVVSGKTFTSAAGLKVTGTAELGGDIDSIIDRSITEISSSSATIIGNYAFTACSALTTADFPAATTIGSYAFTACSALTTADFPAATSIESSAFAACSALTTADFPAATSIKSSAFASCSALKSLLLRGNNVCTLSSKDAFDSTPIKYGTGYIYVPSSLIEQYKAATNWSTYNAQFRALEVYTVDGTITGELDPSKVGV